MKRLYVCVDDIKGQTLGGKEGRLTCDWKGEEVAMKGRNHSICVIIKGQGMKDIRHWGKIDDTLDQV